MKSNLLKLTAVALCVAMLVGTAACKLRDDAPAEAASAISPDEVAITVGGSYTVTRGQVQDAYDSMASQYAYYSGAAPTEDADVESLQDAVVDSLVSEQIQLYQAEQMGITVTDDMRDQIDADVEDEMAQLLEYFRSMAESEGAADVEARTIEIINEQLEAMDMGMDYEGYREYVREQIEKEYLINALRDKVKGEVTVTDEEVRTYYDNLLSAQKETYAETPATYLEDAEGFEKFGGDPVLVTPEGFIRVKTIMIVPQGELSADYDTMAAELTQLETEFGNLSLNNPAGNKTRLAEIRTAYTAKKTEADALYETYVGDARAKAEKAYADLTGGKTFDDALAEYGEDDVYTTYPVFAAEGLLMLKGEATSTWPAELVEAVGKLKNGEYTPVIQVDDIFYIAQLVGDEQPGETSFEDVQEEMQRLATDAKGEEYWTEQLDKWTADTTLIELNEAAYRDIGKQQ